MSIVLPWVSSLMFLLNLFKTLIHCLLPHCLHMGRQKEEKNAASDQAECIENHKQTNEGTLPTILELVFRNGMKPEDFNL